MKLSFKGKSAIVTGTCGGMGLEVSQNLSNNNISVLMVDLKEPPKNFLKDNKNCIYKKIDVTHFNKLKISIEKFYNKNKQIDYLINTTGVLWFNKDVSSADIDPKVWDKVYEINLKSMVYLSRIIIPKMKKNTFGSMVHISSVDALSNSKGKLICKVSQLVKLIKDKKPFKMSKRKGDYITVDDLVNEVGKDATRFIMLNRSSDVELDFDFDNVIEKSKENPLYYVQYSYARIASVFRHLEKDLKSDVKIDKYDFLYSEDEINILKKISEWPKCIDASSQRLEPHRIPTYLYELASLFHSYWSLGKDNPEKRFINDKKNITDEKLIFLKAISNVIKSGMDIVGVSVPEKM